MLVRLLIWNLADSQTTIDELRHKLPALEAPSEWVSNEAAERFGLIVFGDELPEGAGWAQDLIGADPNVYEEWDTL